MSTQREPYDRNALTEAELAHLVGIQRHVVRRMVQFELIEPSRAGAEFVFHGNIIPRVRKLVRLHYQLQVSWSSMNLVLDLLDRIDEMEARLKEKD